MRRRKGEKSEKVRIPKEEYDVESEKQSLLPKRKLSPRNSDFSNGASNSTVKWVYNYSMQMGVYLSSRFGDLLTYLSKLVPSWESFSKFLNKEEKGVEISEVMQ